MKRLAIALLLAYTPFAAFANETSPESGYEQDVFHSICSPEGVLYYPALHSPAYLPNGSLVTCGKSSQLNLSKAKRLPHNEILALLVRLKGTQGLNRDESRLYKALREINKCQTVECRARHNISIQYLWKKISNSESYKHQF